MPKRKMSLDPELAAEAKSLVALAFRNGPIEDALAGKECPTCTGESEYLGHQLPNSPVEGCTFSARALKKGKRRQSQMSAACA